MTRNFLTTETVIVIHDILVEETGGAAGLRDAGALESALMRPQIGYYDGIINFFDDNSGRAKCIVVQVKSGGVNRGMIATLKGDMEREKAEIGLFVTLNEPTRPMLQEAASAGFYAPEHYPDHQYPRLQILTVAELLDGAEAQYPRVAPAATFRRAPRRRGGPGRQTSLV